jgi:hypothetical protein
MPLYYFILVTETSVPAEPPEELPDDEAARRWGEQVAKELARGREPNSQHHILVRNGNGEDVHTIYLFGMPPSKRL